MGKKQADAPNYRDAAIAEGEQAREITEAQTWANRPTQVNPWGQIEWTNTPTWDPTTKTNINRWTQTQTLDPEVQAALNAQIGLQRGRSELGQGMMADLQSGLGPRLNWSQFGPQTNVTLPTPAATGSLPGRVSDVGTTNYAPEQLQRNLDFSQASQVDSPEFTRQSAEESLYNRQAQRLNEQFGGEQQALEIKLANQGLRPGDQAYDAAMRSLNQRKTDAFQGAQAQAMQLGGQEAQRMFDMQQRLRGMQTGETAQMADFYNQAALQGYGMMSGAQQQAFQDRLAAGQFQNQARDAAMREQMAMQGFNQDQLYRYADYQNQLRQQAMNEALMQRSQRLNEVNALISGQQVGQPQFSPFVGAGAAQAPQLLAAAQLQGQQNAANTSAQNQGWGNLFGGLTSLAGAGMMGGYF